MPSKSGSNASKEVFTGDFSELGVSRKERFGLQKLLASPKLLSGAGDQVCLYRHTQQSEAFIRNGRLTQACGSCDTGFSYASAWGFLLAIAANPQTPH